MSYIRGTALYGFAELVTELGGDPAAILRSAGVPAGAAGDPDTFVNFAATARAVGLAADATGAKDFGRRLATRQGIEILGPVGVAARTAPTVGAALESFGQYMYVYSPAIRTSIEPAPDGANSRLRLDVTVTTVPDNRQRMELTLGVALRVFRLLTDRDHSPLVVHVPHSPLTEPADYRAYFGTRVRFDEPFAGFTIRAGDLARPLSSDSAVHEVVRRYLDSVAPAGQDDVVAPVRDLIRRMLPTGGLALEPIAAHLSMHPRTLQRRLADEGTSFAALTDDVRREVVGHHLRSSGLPLGQLTALVGYTEQSALTRSCRRWFDESPSGYRRAARAGR